MPYATNDEFFTELRQLVEGWCERRSLRPLSHILGPYLGFNGLTDAWAELVAGLKSIRAIDKDELTPSEQIAIDELIRAADQAIHR